MSILVYWDSSLFFSSCPPIILLNCTTSTDWLDFHHPLEPAYMRCLCISRILLFHPMNGRNGFLQLLNYYSSIRHWTYWMRNWFWTASLNGKLSNSKMECALDFGYAVFTRYHYVTHYKFLFWIANLMKYYDSVRFIAVKRFDVHYVVRIFAYLNN